jgi:carboxymethylenebutenolidase
MNDVQRYLVEEFVEEYKAGRMDRRDLLKRITLITGAAASASMLVQLGVPDHVEAAVVPGLPTTVSPQAVAPNDPAIIDDWVTFPGTGATIRGYMARPSSGSSFAGVVICHENRGLVPHLQDVTRRAAKAGFAALAVDLLSREGGTEAATAADAAAVPGALGQAPPDRHVADFGAGIAFLQSQSFVRAGGVGMTGFCFGGGITWRTAVSNSAVVAAAPFYGPNPPLELVQNLAGPVTAFYGGDDARINAGIPAMVGALMENKKVWSMHVYAGAPHAFHNDQNAAAYRPDAAVDAWGKTIALWSSALPKA